MLNCLFLHNLHSANQTCRLHSDEIHPITHAFYVECGQALGIVLLVNPLTHSVGHHNVAIFLRKVEAEQTVVRIGIHRKRVHVVLIKADTPAKDKLGVGTVLAHLFWTDKRP